MNPYWLLLLIPIFTGFILPKFYEKKMNETPLRIGDYHITLLDLDYIITVACLFTLLVAYMAS